MAVLPHARAFSFSSSDCFFVASKACLTAMTRRPADSMAVRDALAKGAAGIRSEILPKRITTSSPEVQEHSSLSSQACHSFNASMSCWSASLAFACCTTFSSRARDSFNSCQYSRRTASSPTALSSHSDLTVCLWSLKTVRSVSSERGSCAPPVSSPPFARARSFVHASLRSSSAKPPQAVCCTCSQAPLTLRVFPSFSAETS
mmetsp:Transcript_24683/g.57330  ORF Transcript_24683/g.57330 Transcript_24683/m.57330 type:complete len:203 (-) Transcript_24683:310-918(-)